MMRSLIFTITFMAVLALGFLIPSSAIAESGLIEASVNASSEAFLNQAIAEGKQSWGNKIDKNGYPILTRVKLKDGYYGVIPFVKVSKDIFKDPPFVTRAVEEFANLYGREVDKFVINRFDKDPRLIFAVDVYFCPRRGCCQ